MGLHDFVAKYGTPMDWDDYLIRAEERFRRMKEEIDEKVRIGRIKAAERRRCRECRCRFAIKHFDETGRMLKCESCGRVNVFEKEEKK